MDFAQVCELYCGKVPDEEKLDEAQIGHYIGIGNSVYLSSYLGFCDYLFVFVFFTSTSCLNNCFGG